MSQEEPKVSGFQKLDKLTRTEARMRPDGQYTDEDVAKLKEELNDIRLNQGSAGQPLTLSRLAAQVGVSQSVLSEWMRGRYQGDNREVAAKVDDCIARRRKLADRHQLADFAMLDMCRQAFGVLEFGAIHRSCPALIAEPGFGKTKILTAFAADRPDRYLIRPKAGFRDAGGFTALVCKAVPVLRKCVAQSHNRRMDASIEFFHGHQNGYILIDEAQQLTRGGLECARDIHDETTVPVAFAGDLKFFTLIGDGRVGRSGSRVEAQLSSRIYPIFRLDECALNVDGDAYTVGDLLKVLRAERVKVISPDGARWLTRLANISGWGRLRLAVAVFKAAREIASNRLVEVRDLLEGFKMVHVSEAVRASIDEAANGELLRAMTG